MSDTRYSDRKPVWRCKIGISGGPIPMPDGCDGPMRAAVREAYIRITGREPEFIFSGWNSDLTEIERAVVEDRAPDPEKV